MKENPYKSKPSTPAVIRSTKAETVEVPAEEEKPEDAGREKPAEG